MNFALIAALIVGLLVIGMTVNGFIQRREQQAAERRHRVAQHRASVRDGQDMLELGKDLPLESSVRDILCNYIQLHLQSMRAIDPNADGLAAQEQWLTGQRQLNQQKSTEATAKLVLPSQSAELTALRTQLHRMAEFVARLRQDKRLDPNQVVLAFKSLARLRLRCDVEGHIKLGELAVLNKQNNLAKQYFKYASDRLVQENISDSYVQEQLHTLDKLMAELRGDVPADGLATAEPQPDAEKDTDKEMDPLFAPKKKW
ncbi:hypothetical protein HPT27_14345 [Permianibacter sp. IMCC34836]|uniref:hypothetical protein n=1 Tax=Permianibacter fluminis TaxID=2738515 RepID=UPI0015551181|nr:hypothetical protein [Permianibacter fluminis]NQD38204.1 hypothetical protein [Permianibacter fluminis]